MSQSIDLQQEVQFRLIFSCIVSSAISTLLLFAVSCIEHVTFSYPWQWIYATVWSSLSAGRMLGYCCNGLTVTIVTILFYSKITVIDRIPCKYFQLCTDIMWKNLQTLLLCAGLAGLNTLFVLNVLAPPRYASLLSDSHAFMLNQRAHCLISCGAFMGLVFCITLVLFNRLTLVYSQPPTTLFQIIREHTITKALTTVGRIFYFVPFYALCPKPFCDLRYQRFPIWWLLMDVRMIVLMFLVGFHLQFSWGCAVTILKWQFSKPITYPLTALTQSSDANSEVFGKTADPKKKHLALQRLADLVAVDASARENVYALNALGGRSVLWRQISNWSIGVLEQFLSHTQEINGVILQKNVSASLPFVETKYHPNLSAGFRLRSRSVSSIQSNANRIQENDTLKQISALPDWNAVFQKLSKFTARLPIAQSLKCDLPYAITAQLFSGYISDTKSALPQCESGQSIIWAIEILSCLTLASYTEDTYGCVQRSLGRILVLFAELLDAVERHLRIAGLLIKEVAPSPADVYRCAEDTINDNSPLSPPVNSHLKSPSPVHRSPWKIEDVCSLAYYRFSSDPSLPWRIYATLMWATTNCLKQFGDHTESMPISQKAKERLRLLKCRLANDQLNGNMLQRQL